MGLKPLPRGSTASVFTICYTGPATSVLSLVTMLEDEGHRVELKSPTYQRPGDREPEDVARITLAVSSAIGGASVQSVVDAFRQQRSSIAPLDIEVTHRVGAVPTGG